MNRTALDLRRIAVDLIDRRRRGEFGAPDESTLPHVIDVYAVRLADAAEEVEKLAEQARRLSAREIEGLRFSPMRRVREWIALRFGRFA